MASERRAQVVQLAELLGIEFERGVGTAELMTACIAEVEGRGRNWGEEPEEESEGPPEGFRPALRSVAEASTRTSSRSSGVAEPDAAEESGGEVAPALTHTRREKRWGGVRKAS